MKIYPAHDLLRIARRYGVEALIQDDHFRLRSTQTFEWDEYPNPDAFLNHGNKQFALEFQYEFWLIQNNAALLGTFSPPSGLLQDEFITWLCLLQTPEPTMRPISFLRGERPHFIVYTGAISDLVERAALFR